MLGRRLRVVLAAAVTAPLLVVPGGALAGSAPLTCQPAKQTGLWQRLPVAFKPVPGVRTSDVLTAYSIDAARPQRVLATNGNTIRSSDKHGCDFQDSLVLGAQPGGAVPLSGVTSTIVATASLPRGPSLALVREGSGPASRPHVLRSGDARPGSWSVSDSGLPAQGSPRLLEPANDGSTAYVSLSPATDSGGSGGTLPSLPGVGGGTAGPAGLLYATTDGGRSWQLRTTAAALPSGVTGFDALAVDPANPNLLYALSGGRLVVSRDGGRSLTVAEDVAGATAVEPMEAGEVAVATGGQLLHSKDGATSFNGKPAPAGVGSLAYRSGDGFLVAEAEGRLVRVDARNRGGSTVLDAGVPASKGSARGDRTKDGSFHAVSGNLLLRYVDPRPPKETAPTQVLGDLGAPPPPKGSISPGRQSVQLPVGQSRELDFTLNLPTSPTPLDLYLVVDTSESMRPFLVDLKKNLAAFTRAVQDSGVDLRVGIATTAAGPAEGEPPYPEVDPGNPGYRKPQLYKRIRAIGEVGPELTAAVQSIEISRPPQNRRANTVEGQLLALDELVDGDGVESEQSTDAVPLYSVPPGQAAEFREVAGVRRVVALATDQEFTKAAGTPQKPDGSMDKEGVAAKLKARGIRHLGLGATENSAAKPDLQLMSRLTETFAPPGGVDCGDEIRVAAGAPLVCEGTRNFTGVLARLVKALSDRQSVSLVPRKDTGVLGALDAGALRDLDVTAPNAVPFRARISCVDVAAGRYTQELDAVMRGSRVATTVIDVTCTPVAAAAAVPPRPDPPVVQEPAPPAQPVAQAPAAPAPAPPVVQAQTQPQTQVQSQLQAQTQVQPLTAAALQRQEELQLALALLGDERAVPGNELAMVDRRRGEELRALALLAVSMTAASAFGLARLRTRREAEVRVRRAR